MREEEILRAVAEIMARLLERPDFSVTMQTKISSIAGWDSMRQVMFVLAIEEKFAIRLRNPEIGQLHSAGDAVRIIGARLG